MTTLQICALVTACLTNLMAVAAPVEFTVRVNGPDGPLAHFPLAVTQGGGERFRGETNQEGVASFSLESTFPGNIRVSATLTPARDDETGGAFRIRADQFSLRCQTLALPNYWEFSVALDQGPVSKTISIARGVKLTVQPVGLPQSIGTTQTILIPGVALRMSEFDQKTGMISRFGVPVNTASIGFLQFYEKRKPARAVAFSIPAATTDIDLGALTIPPITMNAKVHIRQLWTKATDKRSMQYRGVGVRSGGITLVSPDGLTILSDRIGPEDPLNREGTEHVKTSVPAGTFYVLPGSFMANPEQMVVISRLRAGQDLSNRGLPMFTIAAGEEKTIEVNNVDMLNAIHAIEDGK